MLLCYISHICGSRTLAVDSCKTQLSTHRQKLEGSTLVTKEGPTKLTRLSTQTTKANYSHKTCTITIKLSKGIGAIFAKRKKPQNVKHRDTGSMRSKCDGPSGQVEPDIAVGTDPVNHPERSREKGEGEGER